jgi:hypothetical protein
MLVRQGMTLVPEKRELFAEMSVWDNLLLGAFDRYRAGHRDQLETIDRGVRDLSAPDENVVSRWPARFPEANARCSRWVAP